MNIVVGSWIGATLLFNLFLATRRQPQPTPTETQQDLILSGDQRSPVGYVVPSFPDFPIDPSRAKNSISFLALEQELYLAVVVAVTMLGAIVSMAFTGWSKAAEKALIGLVR